MVLSAIATASAPAAGQGINEVSGLSFGNFIASSGGTITVAPGGGRLQTGSVVLVGQGSSYAPAQFTVSGTANATYTITLPSNNTVALTDAASHAMALNYFQSNPPTGMLSGGGSQVIHVGATLTVGNGQAPGNYAGSFNVTVNY
jgi:hypothetical protein